MGLQYSIHEVANLQFNTFSDNKPFLYADYAQISTNDISGTSDQLVGGQGNYTLDVHSHTKKSDMKITLPVIDLKFLAMMFGSDLAEAAGNAFQREVLTVTGGKATVAQTPIAGTLFVNELQGIRDLGTEYTLTASAPTGQEYSLSGKDLTFASSEENKTVVVFYQYAAPTGSQTITLTANKFPKAFTIYADGIWNDMETETNKAVKIIVFKAIPQTNFSITMDSTKYSDFQLTFDLMAIKDNTTGNLKYIDYIVLP